MQQYSKVYGIKVTGGEWEFDFDYILFVTAEEKTAINYKEKFNKLLKRVRQHIKPYINDRGSIKEEYWGTGFWWEQFWLEANEVTIVEIEVR